MRMILPAATLPDGAYPVTFLSGYISTAIQIAAKGPYKRFADLSAPVLLLHLVGDFNSDVLDSGSSVDGHLPEQISRTGYRIARE